MYTVHIYVGLSENFNNNYYYYLRSGRDLNNGWVSMDWVATNPFCLGT